MEHIYVMDEIVKNEMCIFARGKDVAAVLSLSLKSCIWIIWVTIIDLVVFTIG